MAQTVLVIGATGIIGNSVTIASLRTGRKVLAIVCNSASAEKMFEHLEHIPGARDAITTVKADVTSENGIQGVVDQVKAALLPAFQHVYASLGMITWTSPLQALDYESFRTCMRINVDGNFFAYKATIPYLVEHGGPNATYTLVTGESTTFRTMIRRVANPSGKGAAGELGFAGVTAMTQGALFSLAIVASRETAETNVRFNEVFLSFRVEFDKVWKEKGGKNCTKASDFATSYENVLKHTEVRGCRVTFDRPDDLEKFQVRKKIQPHWLDQELKGEH